MILLEMGNRVLYETLLAKFQAAKPESVNIAAVDFDGVYYLISNAEEGRNIMLLSARMKAFADLKEHGAEDLLKREYGEFFQEIPEPGYDVTLRFVLEDLPEDKASVAKNASLLKRNCFAAVFEKYFKMQEAETASDKTAVIHYHEEECMYIEAMEDRVTVIFSTLFKDPDDVIIGKVFLQEFKDARKRYQQAPQVLFNYGGPPAELKDKEVIRGDNIGYVTFVLFPRHTNPEQRENTINLIHQFRTYLHYHIKCSKAYLHCRMRGKTANFLQVMERARPEADTDRKKGRTFA